jgi:hypothetical protein
MRRVALYGVLKDPGEDDPVGVLSPPAKTVFARLPVPWYTCAVTRRAEEETPCNH